MKSFLDWNWRHGEGILFWILTFLCLIPVWTHRFIPTQDGASHLDNAQILKGLVHAAANYEAYYEIRAEPLPNWTSHLLLAGLLYGVPALVAEKLLVSIYIAGFAGSFRYFLGSFGDRCLPGSWLGLLFVYNRCFWMGFFNYCLSLIGLWLIMGFCLRRRGEPGWTQVLVLMVLFPLTYFTHLAGFLLAVTAALGASLLVRPRRMLAPMVVGLAALPSSLLMMDYFERTAFFAQGAGHRLVRQPLHLFHGQQVGRALGDIGTQILALDREIFEHHAGPRSAVSVLCLLLFGVFAAVSVAETWRDSQHESDQHHAPGWLFPLLLGLLFLSFYLFLADSLGARGGSSHGSYLKPRLALLPPLLWLACLRESANARVRLVLRGFIVTLLVVNLFYVEQTFRADNEILTRFTVGVEAVGRGQRLATFGIQRTSRPANPLAGARHYYCLDTDNLSLFNYEANTSHFPIKYRDGVKAGQPTDADILIYWHATPAPGAQRGELVFKNADLHIFRRRR